MARAIGDLGESVTRFCTPALRTVLEGKPVKRMSLADIRLRGSVAYRPALGLKGLAASAEPLHNAGQDSSHHSTQCLQSAEQESAR